MYLKKVGVVLVCLLTVGGCVGTPAHFKNTSLDRSQFRLLEKYNINSGDDYGLALTETETYNLTRDYWGVITLAKLRIEAESKGMSVRSYLDEQARKKLERDKYRNEMRDKLAAGSKSDTSLNLQEPIYLTCSRVSRRPMDGATARSVSYVTLRSKTLDYVEIYDRFSSAAGQIDQRDTFFEKPIDVTRFKIKALKGGGDIRNNITLDRRDLKLTHIEYLRFGSKMTVYPNNVYSFGCDFSSLKTSDWQKKTFENYKKKLSNAKKRREENLKIELKRRQF